MLYIDLYNQMIWYVETDCIYIYRERDLFSLIEGPKVYSKYIIIFMN